jgi:hypothetical protein
MPKKKNAPKTPNKTRFVLALPNDMPAADVIAKGKAAGLTLTDKYIYSIRSKARAGSGRVGRPGRPGRPPKAASGGESSVSSRFLNLALDIGLSKAEELLANLRANIKRSL